MWLRLQWVPEEDQKIYLVANKLGPDLLIATQLSSLKLVDREAQLLFQNRAGLAVGVVLCSPSKPRLYLAHSSRSRFLLS